MPRKLRCLSSWWQGHYLYLGEHRELFWLFFYCYALGASQLLAQTLLIPSDGFRPLAAPPIKASLQQDLNGQRSSGHWLFMCMMLECACALKKQHKNLFFCIFSEDWYRSKSLFNASNRRSALRFSNLLWSQSSSAGVWTLASHNFCTTTLKDNAEYQ